ncbi:MAG TPA: type II toxin-antitoxin system HicA family toxin [Candidatus Hydrogenedentes bacterium]|nr:type II toxin-antitoxin system HicA family toxin [Candidatus Hydrogenedentota bacterium]HNT88701.1 type II toxin-antitoxin system HicA family toxin [Candidatus Hydrogenedentota bacterium]
MKREALLKVLRRSGCCLKREGASHSLWYNPDTGRVEAVPRHAEISERLARRILRTLTTCKPEHNPQ